MCFSLGDTGFLVSSVSPCCKGSSQSQSSPATYMSAAHFYLQVTEEALVHMLELKSDEVAWGEFESQFFQEQILETSGFGHLSL